MSVPTTADDFFQLIRKSGLIDEAKLSAFAKAHQHDGVLQQEPKKLASAMVRDGVLTYFHAEQFLLGKWRGFNLGKYRLLERIGIGGMGQVFLCEHVFMRKRVAIKVLPPAKAEDPVTLGRFYREARVASALDHPNIVRTFDIDQDGPLHFLVMEYVDGTSLLDIVKKHGPMNYNRACHYIRQAAIGLQYAHQSGMIHRDIKPGNIMIDRQGTAKILDMGLARFYKDEKDQLTLKYDDKNVLGTADYVAPEQTRDSRNIDVRADIYGLGATFYFVLAGQPPFPEGTVAEKLIAHQTKKPRSILEIRKDVPQGLAKILDKMLAKDPADRYSTPQEIANALEIYTLTPIEPPPSEEMPKLSPAAQEEDAFARKPAGYAAARETVHARSADTSLGRTPSLPRLPNIPAAAIESAATVPLPKKPSLTPPAVSPAAKSESVIDLLTPPKPRPQSTSEVEITETRPLPSDPTPQSTAKPAAVELPKPPADKPKSTLDIKIPGFDLSRLQRPPTGPAPDLGKTPATPASKPVINIPKPQTFLPGSRELPKPAPLPGSRDLPKPAPLPSSRETPLPGSKETKLPPSRETWGHLPGSKDMPKPLALSPSREAPKPAPLSGSREGPKPEATLAPIVSASANQPAYKPPELMPFFNAPPTAPRKPAAAFQLFRWIVMMTVSSLIGAGLGTAIWYLFLR